MIKPDLGTCTVQEACDYAVYKIVEQGKQCTAEGTNMCLYSDGEGNHCAVGWLLDHEDKELMAQEGSVRGILKDFEGRIPKLIIQHLYEFTALQELHDSLPYERENKLILLQDMGIDTSKPQYEQWLGVE